jgi:hypothetical protein
LSDFYYVFPSLNFLVLGVISLVAMVRRRTELLPRTILKLALYSLLTLGITLLLSWGCYINHHQSYQVLLALHLVLVLALLRGGIVGKSVLVANVAYVFWVWLAEPMNHFYRYSPTAIAIFVASLSGLCLLLMRARTRDREQLA